VSPEVAETQAAVRDVVRQALDRDADWTGLASAGLLSLPVPADHGGEGLGLAEVAVLLREYGRRSAAARSSWPRPAATTSNGGSCPAWPEAT
jgi:alkylation response protein AidB-like acyl-CoA dehydrogenase